MPLEKENERKKEYLRSYRDHVRRVHRIGEEIKELEELQKSIKGMSYDGMPHGSGGYGDLSDEMARIDDLIEQLKKEQKSRIESYNDIRQKIKELKCQNEDDVLFYRYIKGMNWWEIAEKMNYSERWILKLHGKALAHLKIPEVKKSS